VGRKKLDDSNVNPSSCAVNFTQTNLQTSATFVGDASMPNPSVQPMNHFHSRTIIDGSAPTFGTPQQTMACMFRLWYMHTTPSFSMPNPGPAPYTPRCNGRTYANNNDNFEVSYSTVAYTNTIPLPGSLAGFLLNSAYHNTMWYNT
jgi:hypothetical protein